MFLFLARPSRILSENVLPGLVERDSTSPKERFEKKFSEETFSSVFIFSLFKQTVFFSDQQKYLFFENFKKALYNFIGIFSIFR